MLLKSILFGVVLALLILFLVISLDIICSHLPDATDVFLTKSVLLLLIVDLLLMFASLMAYACEQIC